MVRSGFGARPLLLAALCNVLAAQQGDKAGEAQPEPEVAAPPAPPLTAEEELRTFQVAKGLHVELAAAEPLVVAPVALSFGADASVWVVEMRGFMPNVDGEGERAPVGCIAVLRDSDGDGRLDARSEFLSGLVLPRAVLPVRDGALVLEPPRLWWCRDRDGDGRADEKLEVADGFEEGLANPEHAANSLTVGLDNWVHMARHPLRLRLVDGIWRTAPDLARGQWGLAHDDSGRFYYCYNSDCLRADLWPSHYAARHPRLAASEGVNWQVVRDQAVWPIRPTPGVNRGYRDGQLRADGRLATFTAAGGVAVYRDDWLGADWRDRVFVGEPAGNLVRACALTEASGLLRGANAVDGAEALASSDERFRPVNVHLGPDGALWVVDFYRGLIQHRNFVTTYLRKQVLTRGLEQPLDRGRLWRIVPEPGTPRPLPRLDHLASADLVARLASASGWVRDTAQRLLVERQDRSVAPALAARVREAADWRERLHALWTLEGLGGPDPDVLRQALGDPAAEVRASAVRLLEARPDARDPAWTKELRAASQDAHARVRWQAALTLGALARGPALRGVLRGNPSDAVLRGAALSGLAGRELEQVRAILGEAPWRDDLPGHRALLGQLASLVVKEGDASRTRQLVEQLRRAVPWQQRALLDGMLAARRRTIEVAAEPTALAPLLAHDDAEMRRRATDLQAQLRWPGRGEAGPAPRTLTIEEQARLARGEATYAATCQACHQASGAGLAGLAPPLAGSALALGAAERLVKITLHGLIGPIEVAGERWDMHMPGWPQLDDEQVAAVLTYVRRSWGNEAEPVAPEAVARVRAADQARAVPWTAAELQGR